MVKGDRWEDHFTRRAKDEKWLARSVYKLEEIDKKFKLIRQGHRLLDLGCYPGSWSQYGIKKVGKKGEVVGVDLKEPDRLSAFNFRFINADVLTLDIDWLTKKIGPRDAVISDLAPQTTGIKITDTSHSVELARKALDISAAVLQKKGHFLCKVFEGEDIKSFRNECAEHFDQVRLIRPSAVRRGSREVYLLGLRRKA
jgi:23S rRNA (uridine2552-2'-O)-methyltransferase